MALAEKELRYAGILTVVDGVNFPGHLSDPRISGQLRAQVQCADLIAVSKTPPDDADLQGALQGIGVQHWIGADDRSLITAFLLGDPPVMVPAASGEQAHPGYVRWSCTDPPDMTRAELNERLSRIPPGVLRVKGVLPGGPGRSWEVHVVGTTKTISPRYPSQMTGVVALGLKEAVTRQDIDDWWHTVPD